MQCFNNICCDPYHQEFLNSKKKSNLSYVRRCFVSHGLQYFVRKKKEALSSLEYAVRDGVCFLLRACVQDVFCHVIHVRESRL